MTLTESLTLLSELSMGVRIRERGALQGNDDFLQAIPQSPFDSPRPIFSVFGFKLFQCQASTLRNTIWENTLWTAHGPPMLPAGHGMKRRGFADAFL